MDAGSTAPVPQPVTKAPESTEQAPSVVTAPPSGSEPSMSGALPPTTDAAPKSSTEPAIANGTVEDVPKDTTSEQAAKPAESTKPSEPIGEVEMKDAETAEATNDSTVASETPKKATEGKRKSVGGGPGGKKLNKKKSIAKITHLDAKPGDYFFARLKSYPPWPSMICDEEMLPQSLLSTRPVTTMKDDGTYNEAYADDGKKVMDRTYPVMFLYTNEFAWIVNTDLTPLNPEDLKDAAEKGKSKSLFAAYQTASEGHDLQYFKDMLADHARAIQEDEERREAKEAEKEAQKAAKAQKKKQRKSVSKAEDVEMEDAGDEVEGKKASKKRKKEADDEEETTEKPAKTPKTTKLKLTTNKTPTTSEKKAKDKTPKPKADKKKSKAAASDEEMADAPEEIDEKPIDPEEARNARNKEVLFLRHKLQKGFLARDQAPQEDEMPQMSNFIKKLENYGDLDFNTIKNTKINKVLKALVKLNTIPKDEEFQFRKRSIDLLAKWNKMIDLDTAEGESSATADKDSKATPTTNGVHDEKSEEKNGDDMTPVEKPEEKPVETSEPPKVVNEVAEPKETAPKPESVPTAVDSAKPIAEATKTEAPIEKAPESAAGAAEAAEVVKATE